MDLVPMQQEIDGETRHITVHPGAVDEWKSSGWEVAGGEAPVDEPAKTLTPVRGRGAAVENQEA